MGWWWPFSGHVQQSNNTYPMAPVGNPPTGPTNPTVNNQAPDPVQLRRSRSSLLWQPGCQIDDAWTDWPWKYTGYPLFTKYLASSQEAFIVRRFDQLHARVILMMQDDIVRKEEKLEGIDLDLTVTVQPNDGQYNNGSFREDADPTGRTKNDLFSQRSALLEGLKSDIKNYDEMILNYRTLRADPNPHKREVQNVIQWLSNRGHRRGVPNIGPIQAEEVEYIYKEGDLVQLVPHAKPPLRRLIERWSAFMLGPWFRIRPKGTQFYQDYWPVDDVMYQSDDRISGFITGLSLFIGLVLLIVPLQVLNLPNLDQSKKLGIICGLVSAFLIVLALIMPARPFETLGATAAYAAVLMVFLQVQNQTTTTTPSSCQ